MAGASVAKIGVGAPDRVTGGILVAPAGTTLPTTPSASVSSWTKLGYVGDDGIRPSGTRTSTDLFDWAGDLIYSPQENHSAAFQFRLLSAWDPDVLAEVFGEDNVSTVGSLTTVHETGEPLSVHPWLFDVRDGGKRGRLVIPEGQITAVTESPFVRNGLKAFDCTLTCYKDTSGKKVYRYYDDGSAPLAPTIVSVDPAAFAAAGGEVVEVTGTGFVGTTGVTIDGAGVAFNVISDTKLALVTAAESAGTYDLVVTNATGASAPFTVTYE
ncbi:phage tail tube protein [Nocardia puris]|uniref:IPT/TIG domain-containing protein n=1 Tax=Nocardia puris TaxID=208602 RepID=A0A366CYK4_9NOCA|nr:IPT/TIG domain-containing protein [Nocardia puris]RBO82068.1 IPT/TIG domain-containing protein [Nocardia puris]